jgi:hypothetical protein
MAEPVLAAPVAAPVAQPPKKSHVLLFAVLGSGGLAALLLLAGVVWAAWAIFGGGSTDTAAGTTNKVTTTNKITSGNAKTDSGPSSKDDKSAPPQPVPVKLFAPFKKGDRREVKLVAEVKEETQFEEIDKLPPDLAGALAKDPSLRVATLHGVIRTLEVNEQGGETKIEFTVDHFETRQEGGFQPGQSEPPVPKGTVIIGTLRD